MFFWNTIPKKNIPQNFVRKNHCFQGHVFFQKSSWALWYYIVENGSLPNQPHHKPNNLGRKQTCWQKPMVLIGIIGCFRFRCTTLRPIHPGKVSLTSFQSLELFIECLSWCKFDRTRGKGGSWKLDLSITTGFPPNKHFCTIYRNTFLLSRNKKWRINIKLLDTPVRGLDLPPSSQVGQKVAGKYIGIQPPKSLMTTGFHQWLGVHPPWLPLWCKPYLLKWLNPGSTDLQFSKYWFVELNKL